MDSVGIPWNSNIPVGIRQIPLELMGESKDLRGEALEWWVVGMMRRAD